MRYYWDRIVLDTDLTTDKWDNKTFADVRNGKPVLCSVSTGSSYRFETLYRRPDGQFFKVVSNTETDESYAELVGLERATLWLVINGYYEQAFPDELDTRRFFVKAEPEAF